MVPQPVRLGQASPARSRTRLAVRALEHLGQLLERRDLPVVAIGRAARPLRLRLVAADEAALERPRRAGRELHLVVSREAAEDEVAAEQAAKSPEFKKAWDSYSTFRKDYAIWKDMGYLK